jgi:DNA gyrase inhibitor GyrI
MTAINIKTPLATRVKFIPPVKLAYLRVCGPYAQSSTAAWHAMIAWLEERKHQLRPVRGYGLAHDDPRNVPTGELRYDAAVRLPATWAAVDELTMRVCTFDGGSYAVRRYRGSYEDVGAAVSDAREKWLPNEGLFIDPARPVLSIFHDDPRTTPQHAQRTDICMPVSPERRLAPRE